jgi:short subunit fatty acids transporter
VSGVSRVRGVSATETIFSLFLLTILVVLVMNLFPATMLGVRRSEQKLQAEEIAQSVLAEQMARPFLELELGQRELPPVKLNNREYQVSLGISEHPDRPSDRLRRIEVTIAWVHRGRREKLVRSHWRTDIAR